jgi:RNA polymerase sigma factor (sigma-70 family)
MKNEHHQKLIEDLFKEYLPDIHELASRKSKKYPDRITHPNDLYDAGLHGLMLAIRDFDSQKHGASGFRTYARSRIDGIMQDHCTGNRSFGKEGVVDPAVELASRASAAKQKQASAAKETPPALPESGDLPPPMPEANDLPPSLPSDNQPPPIPGQNRRP